ncbi:hypothetical protein CFC35_21010 [Streptomyces sp. FBKL.4005]|uniref:hypothetical protein n=1 Tax=Streptomyces sp. FBKL.4005 TaxID=2015515 RepID=UPI000B95E864|nr:hypothetical protein [Streptomyces sp. FBKL.4005]OYP16682.1 hypothetical protein CFC35_21010 [Streptomyces sp. FBKL.4005]
MTRTTETTTATAPGPRPGTGPAVPPAVVPAAASLDAPPAGRAFAQPRGGPSASPGPQGFAARRRTRGDRHL